MCDEESVRAWLCAEVSGPKFARVKGEREQERKNTNTEERTTMKKKGVSARG